MITNYGKFPSNSSAIDHHSESTLETTLTNKNEEIYCPLCESDGHDALDCPINLYCLECENFGHDEFNCPQLLLVDDQILDSKEKIELEEDIPNHWRNKSEFSLEKLAEECSLRFKMQQG